MLIQEGLNALFGFVRLILRYIAIRDRFVDRGVCGRLHGRQNGICVTALVIYDLGQFFTPHKFTQKGPWFYAQLVSSSFEHIVFDV